MCWWSKHTMPICLLGLSEMAISSRFCSALLGWCLRFIRVRPIYEHLLSFQIQQAAGSLHPLIHCHGASIPCGSWTLLAFLSLSRHNAILLTKIGVSWCLYFDSFHSRTSLAACLDARWDWVCRIEKFGFAFCIDCVCACISIAWCVLYDAYAPCWPRSVPLLLSLHTWY